MNASFAPPARVQRAGEDKRRRARVWETHPSLEDFWHIRENRSDETRGAENVGFGSDARTDARLRGDSSEPARSTLRGHLVRTDRAAKQEAANSRT